MSVAESLIRIKTEIGAKITLVAVSKTKPDEMLMEAYETGHRDFGENKVQEITGKYNRLPKDINWHFIGHLQSNKVKYIAPFVHLIHSVDSQKLLKEINKRASQNNRTIDVLMQVYIATEESKFGLSDQELMDLLELYVSNEYPSVRIRGLMGMATNSENNDLVLSEFESLSKLFNSIHNEYELDSFDTLSMGMTNDYSLALKAGSNMLRIGSSIFGARN